MVCVHCGHELTDRSQGFATDVNTFVNPSGYTFEVRCFMRASGAIALGPSSRRFSWFPGYAWRVAVCGARERHVGWAFEGPTRFWGLVADAIDELER